MLSNMTALRLNTVAPEAPAVHCTSSFRKMAAYLFTDKAKRSEPGSLLERIQKVSVFKFCCCFHDHVS